MIELAQAQDWPAIQEIFRAAGNAAWSHIFPAGGLDQLNPPDRWREMIGQSLPEGEVWVAKRDANTVGFIILRHSGDGDTSDDTGEIDSFYTHPDVWGQGVGRALMRKGLNRLKEAGFKQATLWTEERNHRPRQLYERAGFQLDGTTRERDLRGTPLRELRFRIPLSTPLQYSNTPTLPSN